MSIWLSLFGCGRVVSILSGEDDPPYRPQTGDTALVKPPPEIFEVDQPCDGTLNSGMGDDLPIDWCQRVSPEPDQFWPGDSLARCGFFNLTGDFDLSVGETPSVMYCDADAEGGLRWASAEPSGGLSTRMVLDTDCAAWRGSGALATLPSGEHLGIWPVLTSSSPGSDDYSYVIELATLGPDGAILDGPWRHTDVPNVANIYLPTSPGAEPTSLLLIDHDEVLWFMSLAEGGHSHGPPIQIFSGVSELSAVLQLDLPVIVSCDGGVVMRGITASGGIGFTQAIPDSSCDPFHPPSIAAETSGDLLVGYSDDGVQHAVLLGSDHQIKKFIDLGRVASGLPPTATATGNGFLVMVGGLGVRLDGNGNETARFHHAAMDLHAQQLRDLRLWSDGQTALFAPVWSEGLAVGIHTYTYDIIELSRATLP